MFTEVAVERRIVMWQPSLLDDATPSFDAVAGRRPTSLPRGRRLGRSRRRLGDRRGRPLRRDPRARAVARLRAADVRPRRRRAPPARPGAGTTVDHRILDADGSHAWALATACACRRSPPTSTATATTRWRGTATASGAVGRTRWSRSCRSAPPATLLLRPDGGGPSIELHAPLGRPARAGRHLPADLRALRTQARPSRPADQRDVPRTDGQLIGRR